MQIILNGCNGQMGHAVAAAAKRDGHSVVAGVDIAPGDGDFTVYSRWEDIPEAGDVIIDFSTPAALEAELAFAKARRLPVVVATTGLSEAQVAMLTEAAGEIPVFFSSNMSLGVALLNALATKAASVLGDAFDVEILEMHHNNKVDAPSGTALTLAKSVEAGLNYTPDYVYDRHDRRQKRDPHEIGISSIRGGSIVGEHQVLFAGQNETVILTHRADSRDIFAVGALKAGAFLTKQTPGMYSMEDLLK